MIASNKKLFIRLSSKNKYIIVHPTLVQYFPIVLEARHAKLILNKEEHVKCLLVKHFPETTVDMVNYDHCFQIQCSPVITANNYFTNANVCLLVPFSFHFTCFVLCYYDTKGQSIMVINHNLDSGPHNPL